MKHKVKRDKLLLIMEGIEKSFTGVQAVQDAHLNLRAGEVLALVGENGAGKSTLIKVLSGAHMPDKGRIILDREEVSISSPLDSQRLGVAVIYQEFNLIPTLTARENIFLGQEKTINGFISRAEERKKSIELFKRLNVTIDPDTLCKHLSVAQQQVVEIVKALSSNARIIAMDEPSATLTIQEVEKLFEIIKELKTHGIGIIYISHRLDEIFKIANRVTVMRDGYTIDTRSVHNFSRDSLIELMVGRKLEEEFPKVHEKIQEKRLIVKNLCRPGIINDVSFAVHGGEILGITGLVGGGKTELARIIFGADQPASGEIFLDGKSVEIRSPKDAIKHGICLLSEDRKVEGLVLGLPVDKNFGLPNLNHWSTFGFVNGKKEREIFSTYIDDLRIQVSYFEQLAKNLSGGNQQKLVLAKWLEADSKVIIFDEPTRGIDVGTKYEIYLLINKLAAEGKAIIMISSELPEVIGMSDRILVMHDGMISGEITDVSKATQEQILRYAMGAR